MRPTFSQSSGIGRVIMATGLPKSLGSWSSSSTCAEANIVGFPFWST